MLTTNDAYLYKFQVNIKSLELKFRTDRPLSIRWHKDDKQSQTDESSVIIGNSVLFKSNTLVMNLTLNKDRSDKFKTKTTTFTLFQHDGTAVKQLAQAKFKVNQILETPFNSYTLQMTSFSIFKATFTFSISEKLVTTVSEFKFSKSPQLSQSDHSSLNIQKPPKSGNYNNLSMGSRKVSIEFDEVRSQKIVRDQVDSLYQQNKRLKTDHDRLAIKTKEAVARSKRGEKVVWWQFKQIVDFYNRKINIHRKVYQQNIERIVFETNEAKDRLTQIIEELRGGMEYMKEKEKVIVIELNNVKQELAVNKMELESVTMKEMQKSAIERSKNQEIKKNSQVIKICQSQARQLQQQLMKKQQIINQYIFEINNKSRQIQNFAQSNTHQISQFYSEQSILQNKISSLQLALAQHQSTYFNFKSTIATIISSADIKFPTPLQLIPALEKLVITYNQQSSKLTVLSTQLSSTLSNSSLEHQLHFLRQQLQQKDRIFHTMKTRDQTGVKSIQQLQSLVQYHKQSSVLYASKLQKELNQSEILRRHLRARQLEIVEKEGELTQMGDRVSGLENQLLVAMSQKENLEEENEHLEQVISSMDALVGNNNKVTISHGDEDGLVDQLHREIFKKNEIIVSHEKRHNRMLEILEQFKDMKMDVNKILALVLDDEGEGKGENCGQNMFEDLERLAVSETGSLEKEKEENGKEVKGNEWQEGLEILYQKLVKYYQKNRDNRSSQKKQLQQLCSEFQNLKTQIITSMLNLQFTSLSLTQQNRTLQQQIVQINKHVQQLLSGKPSFKSQSKLPDANNNTINFLNKQLEGSEMNRREVESRLENTLKECQRLGKVNMEKDEDKRRELDVKERVINRQERQINDYKKDAEVRYGQFTYVQNSLSTLEGNYLEINKRFTTLTFQHSRLADKFNELSKISDKEKEENSKAGEKNKQRETVLEEEVKKLRISSSKLEVEISLMKQQIDTKIHAHFKQIEELKALLVEKEHQLRIQLRLLEEKKSTEESNDRKIKMLESKIKVLENQDQTQKEIIRNKTSSINRQITFLKEEKRQFEQQIRLLKIKCTHESQKGSRSEQQLAQTESKCKQIKQLHELVQKELKIKSDNMEELMIDIRTTKTILETKKQENSALQDKLRKKEDQISQYKKREQGKYQKNLQSQNELEMLRSEQASLKSLIEKNKQENNKLLKQTQNQKIILQGRIVQQQMQISQLNLYVQEMKRSLNLQVKSHQSTSNKQSSHFTIQQQAYQTQMNSFITKQLEMKKSIESANNQILRNKEIIQSLTKCLNTKEMEIQNLSRQYDQNRFIVKQLKVKQKNYINQINYYQVMLQNMKRNEQHHFEQLTNENKKNINMRHVLQSNETQQEQNHKKILNTLNNRIQELENQLTKKQFQLTAISNQKNNNTSIIKSQYHFRIKSLESQCNQVKQQNISLSTNISKLKNNSRKQKQDNTNLLTKLANMERQYKLQSNEMLAEYTKKEKERNVLFDIGVSEMVIENETLGNQLVEEKKKNQKIYEKKSQLQKELELLKLSYQQHVKQLQSNISFQQKKLQNYFNIQKQLQNELLVDNQSIKQLKSKLEVNQIKINQLTQIIKHLQQISNEHHILKTSYDKLVDQNNLREQQIFRQRQIFIQQEQSLCKKLKEIEQQYVKELRIRNDQIKYLMQVNEEKEWTIKRLEERIEEKVIGMGRNKTRG